MISHLGKMPSVVVGATWAARRQGEDVFGLAVVGDGATSTGEFHEALNIASVRKSPVLFLIENNLYSFSTPASAQYHCRQLSDRPKVTGFKGGRSMAWMPGACIARCATPWTGCTKIRCRGSWSA